MARHKLTDTEVRAAKAPPGAALKRFSDGDGLFLVAFASGGKSWQFRYDNAKGAQTVTLRGVDGLAEARTEADRLRQIVARGEDPKVVKLVERVANIAANGQTFEVVKDAWIERVARRKKWSASHREEVAAAFDNHLKELYPIPVSKIRAHITAPMLDAVEKAAPGVVDRVAQRLHSVMDFALEQGLLAEVGVNPLPKRSAAKTERTNFPAITALVPDPKNGIHTSVGCILRAAAKLSADLAHRKSQTGVQRAHLLLAFTALRANEVCDATWKEFDLEAGNWVVPRARMKIKTVQRGAHIVPLPPVLLAQLRAWREADGKGAIFVCPSARTPKRAIRDVQVGDMYRYDLKLGGTHSLHSWRAVFKTVCKEGRKKGDEIEAQLDHRVGDSAENAYDRAKLVEARRVLMTWYESTLIAARDGATVVPIKAHVA